MIDFASVKGIAIPEGNAKELSTGGTVLWSADTAPKFKDLTVGQKIVMQWNGQYREFIVIQQGNPNPSIYDSTFNNGTWLMFSHGICFYHVINNSSTEKGGTSYFNRPFTTFLPNAYSKFTSSFQSKIKQVSVPFRNDTQQCRLFLLSDKEVSNGSYSGGSQLQYFAESLKRYYLKCTGPVYDDDGNITDLQFNNYGRYNATSISPSYYGAAAYLRLIGSGAIIGANAVVFYYKSSTDECRTESLSGNADGSIIPAFVVDSNTIQSDYILQEPSTIKLKIEAVVHTDFYTTFTIGGYSALTSGEYIISKRSEIPFVLKGSKGSVFSKHSHTYNIYLDNTLMITEALSNDAQFDEFTSIYADISSIRVKIVDIATATRQYQHNIYISYEM